MGIKKWINTWIKVFAVVVTANQIIGAGLNETSLIYISMCVLTWVVLGLVEKRATKNSKETAKEN